MLGACMSVLVLSNNFFFTFGAFYAMALNAFVSVALDLTCLIWYKESPTEKKRMQDTYLLPLSRKFYETPSVNFTGFTHLNSHEKWLPSLQTPVDNLRYSRMLYRN